VKQEYVESKISPKEYYEQNPGSKPVENPDEAPSEAPVQVKKAEIVKVWWVRRANMLKSDNKYVTLKELAEMYGVDEINVYHAERQTLWVVPKDSDYEPGLFNPVTASDIESSDTVYSIDSYSDDGKIEHSDLATVYIAASGSIYVKADDITVLIKKPDLDTQQAKSDSEVGESPSPYLALLLSWSCGDVVERLSLKDESNVVLDSLFDELSVTASAPLSSVYDLIPEHVQDDLMSAMEKYMTDKGDSTLNSLFDLETGEHPGSTASDKPETLAPEKPKSKKPKPKKPKSKKGAESPPESEPEISEPEKTSDASTASDHDLLVDTAEKIVKLWRVSDVLKLLPLDAEFKSELESLGPEDKKATIRIADIWYGLLPDAKQTIIDAWLVYNKQQQSESEVVNQEALNYLSEAVLNDFAGKIRTT
jgi:hypothetical protein